jgi:hypothetical protein
LLAQSGSASLSVSSSSTRRGVKRRHLAWIVPVAMLVVVAGCSVGMTTGAIGGGANSSGANVGDTGNADAMVSCAMARNPNYASDYAQVT